MDAIDRRGSFAAAADELGRVPSALSYTMQKLEEELDVVLFDRSGHRTKFTNVGRMLLERGRVLLKRRINSPPMLKPCRAVGKPT